MSKNPPCVDGLMPELPLSSRQIDFSRPIAGTYFVTGVRASQAYNFSKFCMSLSHVANRDRAQADLDIYMDENGLNEFEKELVRAQDWNGMLRYGTSTFLVLKLAGTLGVSQNRVGAAMRGETYEQFMSTRNVKGAN